MGDEDGWGFTGMGKVTDVGGAVVKGVGVVGGSSIITMSGEKHVDCMTETLYLEKNGFFK